MGSMRVHRRVAQRGHAAIRIKAGNTKGAKKKLEEREEAGEGGRYCRIGWSLARVGPFALLRGLRVHYLENRLATRKT
jgi:hypothetical protein